MAADPLGELLHLLPQSTRLLQITQGEGGELFAFAVAVKAGDDGSPLASVQVSRGELPTSALSALLAAAAEMRQLQSKAALSRSKADLLETAAGGAGPPLPSAPGYGSSHREEEEALRRLVEKMVRP